MEQGNYTCIIPYEKFRGTRYFNQFKNIKARNDNKVRTAIQERVADDYGQDSKYLVSILFKVIDKNNKNLVPNVVDSFFVGAEQRLTACTKSYNDSLPFNKGMLTLTIPSSSDFSGYPNSNSKDIKNIKSLLTQQQELKVGPQEDSHNTITVEYKNTTMNINSKSPNKFSITFENKPFI